MDSEAKIIPLETETTKDFEIKIEDNDHYIKISEQNDWRTAKEMARYTFWKNKRWILFLTLTSRFYKAGDYPSLKDIVLYARFNTQENVQTRINRDMMGSYSE